MSKYRLWTDTSWLPYKVQVKRWWGWRTIFRSTFSSTAKQTLDLLRKDEELNDTLETEGE